MAPETTGCGPDETGDEPTGPPELTELLARVRTRKETAGTRIDAATILAHRDAGRR